MIRDTIEKIEARIQKAGSLTDEHKRELRELFAKLKTEVDALSQTDLERAQSIAGFTQVSTHEATRDEKHPQLLQLALKGLASSVEDFETSHPRLVQTVDRICVILSNIGI